MSNRSPLPSPPPPALDGFFSGGLPSLSLPWIRRLILTLAVLTSAIVASTVVPQGAVAALEPELRDVLRAMALIKAGIIALAFGVLWWRFGQPIRVPLASLYIVGLAALAAIPVVVWQLTFLAPASAAFHLIGLSLLGVTLVDSEKPKLRAPSLDADRRLH